MSVYKRNRETSGRFINSKPIVTFLVIAVALMIVLSSYMIHLGLPLDQQLGISFTFAIMVFAGLEGASTYMQVQLADRRYLIEDARNELEKAYGILFTILNYRTTETDNGTLLFDPDDKETIMDIMSRYPWMFPEEINDLWQKQKVHKPEGIVSHGILTITTEFRDGMKEEYHRRVKRYNELLKK